MNVLFLLPVVIVLAQPPDFSGTWKLDESRSRVSAEAPFVGLIGTGAPGTLHVSQAKNGTLIVESQINESQSRIYAPGEKTTTSVFLGQAGTVTMASRWEDQKLVSEGRRESPSDTSTIATEIREVLGLSADGVTLEIEVTVRGAEGEASSLLRYTRIRDVGPCNTWPAPCKF